MAVITWRNINQPNFSAANNLIRDGFQALSEGPTNLNKFGEGLQKAALFEQKQRQQLNTENAIAGIMKGDASTMPAPDAFTSGNFGDGLGAVIGAFQNRQNQAREINNDKYSNANTQANTKFTNTQNTAGTNINNVFESREERLKAEDKSIIDSRTNQDTNRDAATEIAKEGNRNIRHGIDTRAAVARENSKRAENGANTRAGMYNKSGGSGSFNNLNMAADVQIRAWQKANPGKKMPKDTFNRIVGTLSGMASNATQLKSFNSYEEKVRNNMFKASPKYSDSLSMIPKGHDSANTATAAVNLAEVRYGVGKPVMVNGNLVKVNDEMHKVLNRKVQEFVSNVVTQGGDFNHTDISNYLGEFIDNGGVNDMVTTDVRGQGNVGETGSQIKNAFKNAAELNRAKSQEEQKAILKSMGLDIDRQDRV